MEGIWHDLLVPFNSFDGTLPLHTLQFGEGGLKLSTVDAAATGTVITETVEYSLSGRSLTLFRSP
ncbi:hypothetical protein CWM63_28365 [Klebsiella sp. F-Nf9]|nr:hypothetical protein CWM63_28365 [Klebsiella sp. F-Nf9]PKJ67658.1 hypothetical protein CW267_26495 [Klebsiella sp. X1-16S-Nf21]